jgi:N-acetylglucosaminyldiphosphoundecaprenol N-acetyl-beta-D-mannosaminyltransferase
MHSNASHSYVAGMRVDPLDYRRAVDRVIKAAKAGQGGYVCVANVHMTMEAHDDPGFARIVDEALAVTPDGMPLVWGLRALGFPETERVYGPELTLRVCAEAEQQGIAIALYGGTTERLEAFISRLRAWYPDLEVACAIAPPFRELTREEDEAFTRRIAESGAGILFVGIGCPRQERWMAAHRRSIPAVMLGVGAAFDFHAGAVRQAPRFIQKMGLEWAFRLAMEPRRLWRRYMRHNPRFVWHFGKQVLRNVTRRSHEPGIAVRADRSPIRGARAAEDSVHTP